jgi:hypothetical protein
MTPKSTTKDKPRARKLLALLTDDEWRQVRVAAAESDTTIQGYVTNLLLRELQSGRPGSNRRPPSP